MAKRNLTDEQLEELVAAYKATGSVWKAGEAVGISGQSAHYRLKKLGIDTSEKDAWTPEQCHYLLTQYLTLGVDDFDLNKIAEHIGKLKSNVCRKARELGLTDQNRKKTAAQRQQITEDRKGYWSNGREHPRGMLGKHHTEETKQKFSEIVKKRAEDTPATKRRAIARKAAETRVEKYGTGNPNTLNVTNAYSRAKRGFREDIGMYVRSSWEANYARYLGWLIAQGKVMAWEYEPKTFRFEGVKRGPYTYCPDFHVMYADGHWEWHEVKGYFDPKSRSKVKRFKKFFPGEVFVLVDAKAYKAISEWSAMIPGWE